MGSRPDGQNLKQTKAIIVMMTGTVSVKAVTVWPCGSTFIAAFIVVLSSMIAPAVKRQSGFLVATILGLRGDCLDSEIWSK